MPEISGDSSFDPFAILVQPPLNETEEEKQARLEVMREAARVSRSIDADLGKTKKMLERKKRAVKILLLGQPESGQSSVLKSFRLAFTPNYFERERLAWKIVIQLSLISAIKEILNVLQAEWAALESYAAPTGTNGLPPLARDHRSRTMPLSPLLASINQIIDSMGSGRCIEAVRPDSVGPGVSWNVRLASLLEAPSPLPAPEESHVQGGSEVPSQVTEILTACKDEIVMLWKDPGLRDVLAAHGVEMQDESTFFLDAMMRIAALDYVPTDGDIMRVLVRTPGIAEHRFVTESGFRAGTEFFITDVCGSSCRRLAWIPYFDDVQAILFLAPLMFWQCLNKDLKINHVQASLNLWTEIVGNRLLAKTAFILVFTERDALQAKLNAGVMVNKYVPSFRDRSNDVPSVTKYFRDKFSAYHRKLSPEPRPFIFYETGSIDRKMVAVLLGEVQEQIIRNHLKNLDIM